MKMSKSWMEEEFDPATPINWSGAFSMQTQGIRRIMSALVLVLMFIGQGYCTEWPKPPGPQPNQMWSSVTYDPKLSDPFFKSHERLNENHLGKPLEGGNVVVLGNKSLDEGPARSKPTAECFSDSYSSMHPIIFCEAKFHNGNNVSLLFVCDPPGYYDRLMVWVRDGMFTCQYWTLYKAGSNMDLIWTTKRQKLTLGKNKYRQGDVIKGRIDFACVEEIDESKHTRRSSGSPRLIKVFGVFKTTVE